MDDEKMTIIYINRDIYSHMLPNKEYRLVDASTLLNEWGKAIRRPGELWFDMERAEKDFVRKVFDILAPAKAVPLKGVGHGCQRHRYGPRKRQGKIAGDAH